jgi:hypothetical protein
MKRFTFDKLETRALQVKSGHPKYLIKGYAVAPDVEHIYKFTKDPNTGKVNKSFKSLFTRNAIESINTQLKHKKIFVDALHEIASNINSKDILKQLKSKYGEDISEELQNLEANMNMKQLPLFKPVKFDVLDKGLYMEIETNPFFPEVDEKHEGYYNAIVGSLLNKYINGMSLNFKTKDVMEEDGIEKINDVDVFGVSLVPNAALGEFSSITEVAMRSIQEVVETREEKQMEKKTEKTPIQETKSEPQLDVAKMIEAKVEEELKKREIESQKTQQEEEMKKMKEELEQLRKEKEKVEENKPQPKGVISGTLTKEDEKLSEKALLEKIDTLEPGEAIMLQADPEVRKLLPTLVKVQEYPRDRIGWQTKTVFKPIPQEMEQLHNSLTRKEGKDVKY